jgi:NAD(P)-dependent dehydrogenase (short-subunit alcohol dehydrogenase family)
VGLKLVGISSSATKAAILQMTRNLALDYAPHNIRVNSISPGTIFTRASRNHMVQAGMTEKQFRSEEGGKCPLNRVGEAEEMGECAAFLCSDAASYVTGSDLRADGGLVIV